MAMFARLLLAAALFFALPATAQPQPDQALLDTATSMFTMNVQARADAIEKLAARGTPDIAAPLIEFMPLVPENAERIGEILRQITGADIKAEWFEWMLWQEAHPEIRPFAGYDAVKSRFLGQIDLEFLRFVHPGVKSDIRLEEIAWGGLKFGATPALDEPDTTSAADAAWLSDDDMVIGLVIDGDARAYPRRILDWHEMVNDTVGKVPVTVSFCALCYSAIVWERLPAGRVLPFDFDTSGLIYRSNKLMYDHQSESLWSQLTGQPVVGDLAGSGLQLKMRPAVMARWADWRAAHPDTKVLSLQTGHQRDYLNGQPYADYLSNPAMMFPAVMADWTHQPKDRVFGLRLDGAAKSWPLGDFAGGRVINDRIGDAPVVLVGDQASDTVRAYRRDGQEFKPGAHPRELLAADGRPWTLTEDTLVGPAGDRLERLPGQVSFWFAWQSRFPRSSPKP
ncbi:MAG: DUF3179 domain-containing protein [Reyranellaceae bacterium]